MPEFTRAFRFVYPALLVATGNSAYVWDIPTATLVQTIPETGLNGGISYVELSSRHVFICGEELLRIFSREDGSNVLDISSTRDSYAAWNFSPNPVNDSETNSTPGVLVPYCIHPSHEVDHSPHPRTDQFVAGRPDLFMPYFDLKNPLLTVHVSSCGSHLVALLRRSRLLIVYNFECVIRGEIDLNDAIVDVQLGQPFYSSVYLAFEDNRIAVATVRALQLSS
jgi:hypothetical protein